MGMLGQGEASLSSWRHSNQQPALELPMQAPASERTSRATVWIPSCHICNTVFPVEWVEDRISLHTSQGRLLFTQRRGLWNIAVICLHFEIQQSLSNMSLCECSLFSVFQSVTFTHHALGDKRGHLIFTEYAENVPVYMLNFLKLHNLLLSCNTWKG